LRAQTLMVLRAVGNSPAENRQKNSGLPGILFND